MNKIVIVNMPDLSGTWENVIFANKDIAKATVLEFLELSKLDGYTFSEQDLRLAFAGATEQDVFDNPEEVLESMTNDLKQKALSKLTPFEQGLLGLLKEVESERKDILQERDKMELHVEGEILNALHHILAHQDLSPDALIMELSHRGISTNKEAILKAIKGTCFSYNKEKGVFFKDIPF